MSASRIIGLNLILSLLLCVEALGAESRPATLDEIRTLFDLATVGPRRMRVVADIFTYEPKWSQEQIAAEMRYQNGLFKDLAQLPEAVQRERTNAVARSHSGRRVRHVQEWYSGKYYRLDQTDEGMFSEEYLKAHPGVYRNTYVNIDDPALSPYKSFFVDHELRDAQVSKTMLYNKNDLWHVLGLEGEVAFPLLVALLDSKSGPKDGSSKDMSLFKINPAKAELIHNGSHPVWRLEATDTSVEENRTRFSLRGRTMSLDEPHQQSEMEFVYLIGRIEQKPVCMEASSTNHTTHSSFLSKREIFDEQGLPRVWKRTTIKPGAPPKQVDVIFKEMELNPALNDEQIFSPKFATDYIVADVTSGQAVYLQKPSRVPHREQEPSLKRRILLYVFMVVVILVPGIVLLRMKSKKL